VKAVKILWKWKHFEEKGWKRKWTWKHLTFWGARSGNTFHKTWAEMWKRLNFCGIKKRKHFELLKKEAGSRYLTNAHRVIEKMVCRFRTWNFKRI